MNKCLRVTALLTVMCCSGCAANYYAVNGVKFADKEAALSAQASTQNAQLLLIKPYSIPLTEKTVTISIPGQAQILADYVSRSQKLDPRPLSGAALDRLDYLARHGHAGYKFFYEAVKAQGIYAHVDLVEGSYSVLLTPTSSNDVLCAYSSGEGTPVLYGINAKNGKQVLTFDTSLPPGAQRTESMLNTLKAFALQ